MARVPPESEFAGVAGQMFPRNVVPGTDDGPFEQGKERLRSVGRGARTIRVRLLVFAPRVIDRPMGLPGLQGVFVARMLVRVHNGLWADAFRQGRP